MLLVWLKIGIACHGRHGWVHGFAGVSCCGCHLVKDAIGGLDATRLQVSLLPNPNLHGLALGSSPRPTRAYACTLKYFYHNANLRNTAEHKKNREYDDVGPVRCRGAADLSLRLHLWLKSLCADRPLWASRYVVM